MNRNILILFLGWLLCLAAVVNYPTPAVGEDKIKCVSTIGMIADVVANVGGEHVASVQLMGAGVDPHLYKVTRSDVALLNSADAIFYNGLMLEGKMIDALIRVATSGRKVFAVTELIEQSSLLEPVEFQGHFDPHVWMDPKLWSHTVDIVVAKLSDLDKKNAASYRENGERYKTKILLLDRFAEDVLGRVPSESQVLITAHDAFNYFGRRYGYEVLGIQGISTESEAGVKDIERLIDLLVSRKVKAVFVESTVSERNIRALIEGAAARGHNVKIGGQLFSDAMGKPGSYEGTYIGMIDHNVTTIATALGGNAPVGGFEGRLGGK